MTIKDFSEAMEWLGGRSLRKVGNNTYLVAHYTPGLVPVTRVSLRLHSTEVITWDMLGGCVLNSDGWHTRTTLSRINTFCGGYRVFGMKENWWVSGVFPSGQPAVFYDGMDVKNVIANAAITNIHNSMRDTQLALRIASSALTKERNKDKEFLRRSEAAKKGAATRRLREENEYLLDSEFEKEEARFAAKRADLGKE